MRAQNDIQSRGEQYVPLGPILRVDDLGGGADGGGGHGERESRRRGSVITAAAAADADVVAAKGLLHCVQTVWERVRRPPIARGGRG